MIGPQRSIELTAFVLLQAPILVAPWIVISLLIFDETASRELAEEFARAPFTVVLSLAIVACVLGGFILFTFAWVGFVLWHLFGRVELVITPDLLTQSWRLGSLSVARHFQTAEIANMRYRELVRRKGTWRDIVFEYAGRTVSAASLTSEEEAAALLSGPLSALSFRSRRPEPHTPRPP